MRKRGIDIRNDMTALRQYKDVGINTTDTYPLEEFLYGLFMADQKVDRV